MCVSEWAREGVCEWKVEVLLEKDAEESSNGFQHKGSKLRQKKNEKKKTYKIGGRTSQTFLETVNPFETFIKKSLNIRFQQSER